ncbi:hypothetical protein CHS0354_039925 [Potamilus streckersoni]|uniref:Uncharacterized protein n=1 Tax=Potamilus streckersoni TaxID=2493646 RepID=A0AAE0THN2_9BIVA|nr:hypothetical protein CHS0354_039925 [Potamilus streckersoni]
MGTQTSLKINLYLAPASNRLFKLNTPGSQVKLEDMSTIPVFQPRQISGYFWPMQSKCEHKAGERKTRFRNESLSRSLESSVLSSNKSKNGTHPSKLLFEKIASGAIKHCKGRGCLRFVRKNELIHREFVTPGKRRIGKWSYPRDIDLTYLGWGISLVWQNTWIRRRPQAE